MANAMNQTTVNISMNQTTLSDMKKKEEIAPILGIEKDAPFEIVAEEGDLVMVHYRQDADTVLYGNLRGIVVDMKNKCLVSYSFPYAPKFVTNFMENNNENLFIGGVSLNLRDLKFKIGYEGTLIHVFKHGGKVYKTTRKRLDCSKSRWGNSKTFGEIYNDLGGPKDDELFNTEKDYSPYCHYFILVHPDLLISTKDDVGEGYIVYLGPKKIYGKNNCKFPLDQVDFELHLPETSNIRTKGTVYCPEDVTLDEANKHLLFGFYEEFEGFQYLDYRLLPGEFVIVENTKTREMYRIESHSYSWRSEIRNNNPNLLHRFFELIDFAYLKNTPEDTSKYSNLFPSLTFYDQNSIEKFLERNPIVIWPQNTEFEMEFPKNKDDKLYNIWEVFLISVPTVRQKEVLNFFNILFERRNELVSWLIEKSDKIDSLDLSEYSKRAQDILVKTREFATVRFKKGENIDPKTKERKTIKEMTHDNIRNFVSKERGSSLYRLTREMNRDE